MRWKALLTFLMSLLLLISAVPANAADQAADASVLLSSVAYGNGMYIAVGMKGALFTSTDGASWTQRYTGTTEDLFRVAYGDGRFVALASKGLLLTSTDGATWVKKAAYGGLLAVTYGAGRWVVAANDGLYYSKNGSDWGIMDTMIERRHPGGGYPFITTIYTAVAQGNGQLMMIDAFGNTDTSIDETYSTKGSLVAAGGADYAVQDGFLKSGIVIQGLTYGNGRWVAVGRQGDRSMFYTLPAGGRGPWTRSDSEKALSSVTFAMDRFYAVGPAGAIAVSANGTDWQYHHVANDAPLNGIAYGGGLLVAASGRSEILTSRDGLSWASRALERREVARPTVVVQPSSYSLVVNDKPVNADVVLVNERSLVPVRAVAEMLGAEVTWLADSSTVKIVKGKTVIMLPVGSDEATVNGRTTYLDAPAVLHESMTRVPIRFIAESLGLEVTFDGAGGRILMKERPQSNNPWTGKKDW